MIRKTIRRINMAAAILSAALLLAYPATATAGETYHGIVIAASENQVMFKDQTDSHRTLQLAQGCQVTIDGRDADITDVDAGLYVNILVNRNNQCMRVDATSK